MPAPTPVSKVDMDPNYEKQLTNLKMLYRAQEAPTRRGGQIKWMRPDGWRADTFDWQKFHDILNRDQANDQFVKATENATEPGVTGDLISATTMIDYLGTAERALLNRHTMNRCRRLAHVAGRVKGHGHDKGVLVQCGIEYVRRLIARAKGPQ